MEGGDGEKDKWKWVNWQPRVSLLIYQQPAWQRLGLKWMCSPQGSGLLLSNGDKEQRKWGQEGERGEYAQSKWMERYLRHDCCVYCSRSRLGKIRCHSIVTLAAIFQVKSMFLCSSFHTHASSMCFTVKHRKHLTNEIENTYSFFLYSLSYSYYSTHDSRRTQKHIHTHTHWLPKAWVKSNVLRLLLKEDTVVADRRSSGSLFQKTAS